VLKSHGSPTTDDGNTLDVVAGLEVVESFLGVTVDDEKRDQARGQTDILTDRFQRTPMAVGQHNAILLIKPVSAKRFQQSDRPHDNAHGDPGASAAAPVCLGPALWEILSRGSGLRRI